MVAKDMELTAPAPMVDLSEDEMIVFEDIVRLNVEFMSITDVDLPLATTAAQDTVMILKLQERMSEAIEQEDYDKARKITQTLNGLSTRLEKAGRQLGIGAYHRKVIPSFNERLVTKMKKAEDAQIEKSSGKNGWCLDDELM